MRVWTLCEYHPGGRLEDRSGVCCGFFGNVNPRCPPLEEPVRKVPSNPSTLSSSNQGVSVGPAKCGADQFDAVIPKATYDTAESDIDMRHASTSSGMRAVTTSISELLARVDGMWSGKDSHGTFGTSSSHSTSMSKRSMHPLHERRELLSCIKLLRADALPVLSTPLPRSQDVTEELFGQPGVGDQVISVSHAWRNQSHPDPTGRKAQVLEALLARLQSEMGREGSIYLFFDFLSISQRPFQAGQAQRTEVEAADFLKALGCMHEMYFYSDRVIHLPWHEDELEEEGDEKIVPASKVRGATFRQAGEFVQITELPPRDAQGQVEGAHVVQLFDQVLAIDGKLMTTVEQVEMLLSSGGRYVTLRRYPFGLCNKIPPERRGWVFLERFITMVKCAMVDEATAKKIVLTTSPGIFQQIMEGASQLRQAAVDDQKNKSNEGLRRVFDDFTLELHMKKFSAASADKRELNATAAAKEQDRDVVLGIMREFVDHLSAHWQEEAARQKRAAARALATVLEATETYLLRWDHFSPDYSSNLLVASSRKPWPMVVVVTLPLICPLLIFLLPYANPEDGWHSQNIFWPFIVPFYIVTCVGYHPAFLIAVGKVRVSASVLCKGAIYCIYVAVANTTAVWLIAMYFDVFPVPLTNNVGTMLVGFELPVLWWSVPGDQRSSADFRRRIKVAFVGIALVLTLFATIMPYMVEALTLVSAPWQALLVVGFVSLKLFYEAVGVRLQRKIGADAMPTFILTAVIFYQGSLCVAFAKGSSWIVGLEVMAFDAMENLFYLWSLHRQGRSVRSNPEGKEDEDADSKWRREQYIVVALMLREFAEMVVPSQFLLIFTLLHRYRPQYSALFCSKSEEEVLQMQVVFLLDIAVELAVFSLSWGILVCRGHSPLKMLRGIVGVNYVYFAVVLQAVLAWLFAEQHSHYGMRKTFDWLWVWEDSVQWVCGLTWSNDHE